MSTIDNLMSLHVFGSLCNKGKIVTRTLSTLTYLKGKEPLGYNTEDDTRYITDLLNKRDFIIKFIMRAKLKCSGWSAAKHILMTTKTPSSLTVCSI